MKGIFKKDAKGRIAQVGKSSIIVYSNTIYDKKVYIVVFINRPFDLNKAREVLKLYSEENYVGMPTGLNAITFIERKENIDYPLLTTEEFKISKLMLMSLSDIKGNLYDVSFDKSLKELKIEKAFKYEINDIKTDDTKLGE